MKDYKEFLDKVFEHIATAGLEVENLQLDHIAYCVASAEEYEQLKPKFEALGDEYHESVIGGRRIGKVKLYEPFTYKNYEIEAGELIEPKEGESIESRWEHIEFVTDEDYQDIVDKFPDIEWQTRSMERPIYSHLTAVFEDGLKVKFHHNTILECIQMEKDQQ
jgi:predicted metalloenzyme YecM